MNMLKPRQVSGLPLGVQLMALLVCALVGAQAVTLGLTVLFPPEPSRQWNLDDVAQALGGGALPDRLERVSMAGPPDISASGWLVSQTSQEALATRLQRAPHEVVLAFYTQLPVGGVAVPAARSPLASGDPLRWRKILDRNLTVIPSAQAGTGPGGPGGSGTLPGGPMQGGRFPGGGFPGGGFPGGGFPGGAPKGGIPGGGFPGGHAGGPVGSPVAGMPSGVTGGSMPAGIGPRAGGPSAAMAAGRMSGTPNSSASNAAGNNLTSNSNAATTSVGSSQKATIVGTSLQAITSGGASSGANGNAGLSGQGGANGPMGISGMGQAMGMMAQNGMAQQGIGPIGPMGPVGMVATPIPTPTASLPAADPSPLPRASFDADAALSLPSPRLPSGGLVNTDMGQAAMAKPASVTPTAKPQPIPFRHETSGLLTLATPPFIEGDFIAAVRQKDGSWTAVAPRPEPFPNRWQMQVMAWFIASMAIVSPLAWLFARRIVRPLEGFAQAAEALGRDPSATIMPLSGPAEIGRAAYAFNLMRFRLRAFVDDRTAMVGAISHDLRTPLTRLRFRVEDVPDEQREGILKEVTEMEAMIAHVLAFIRDASTPGKRETVDLAELLEGSVKDAQLVGGRIELETSAHLSVEVDPVGIRRLLGNLLENAVKYGEKARVRLSLRDGEAVAEIIDSGPGIPENEWDHVFEPFYRTEAARKSGKPGSGLGLAVCRSIARAHGGDVVLGRREDGFVASVSLPLVMGGVRRAA
ncbi:HAMP domain-containing protein [Novosphingobium umbonatum]|uniref:histidine kinase n=1 Tax=Novosphingobium umbonatum TaxID=1908524 RepID=A0A3S2UVV5_9SPHN|nr:ATP-binding protein [Novosphingobium umbonatum]RVU06426.1 HAMP domain-containing protein [Novosphingobium umbonatum]